MVERRFVSVPPTFARLEDVTLIVSKEDPRKDPVAGFSYVDISAVDQIAKRIVSHNRLLGKDAPSRARQVLQAGDVLVSTVRPNLNAVARVSERDASCIASTGFCVLRPSPKLDSRFLFHWVRTRQFVDEMVECASGASYPAVSDRIIKSSSIPLPLIQEQRWIAAVLDAVDALRAKRRQALGKLDTLIQATFIGMFGDPVSNDWDWPTVTIGDVVDSAAYGTSKKAEPAGKYPVLRMGNITYGGEIALDDLKYVDLDERELKKHLVSQGDVLFNRTNSVDLVGKTAVYRGSAPMAYAGYLVRLRPSDRVDSEYLGTFMNLPSTKQKLRAMCKSIVGMANINAKEVRTIEMPLPPMELQQEFASARSSVADQRSTLEHHANGLEGLFASLQQRAFRGEL